VTTPPPPRALVHQNSSAIPGLRHNSNGLRGLLRRRGGKHGHKNELRRNKHVFQRRLRLVELGRDWGFAGRKIRIRLGSAIPRLLYIGQMSSPDRIDNGSPRIRFPHAHKKAFDEVHLGGGEMAQQVSRTFRWVFGDGLKARKPRDSDRQENTGGLSGLDLKVLEDIRESPL